MYLVGMEDINTGNKLRQRLHTEAQELGIQDNNYYIQAATAEGALKNSRPELKVLTARAMAVEESAWSLHQENMELKTTISETLAISQAIINATEQLMPKPPFCFAPSHTSVWSVQSCRNLYNGRRSVGTSFCSHKSRSWGA